MERKLFLKTLLASGSLVVINPFSLIDLFIPHNGVYLPFIDGVKEVSFLRANNKLVNEVSAQYYQTPYGYHQSYNYQNLAPYQQWYSYQQAVAQWNAYYQQQKQYYDWLNQQYIQQMQYMLQVYGQYQQIGAPSIYPSIQSVYGFAKNPGSSPVLFGVNRNGGNVSIQETTKAAAKVWEEVNDYYGESDAERASGPQTSEMNSVIQLPNNMQLGGKAYGTTEGAVAVSNELVQSADGKLGKLAKYVTENGENYLVV